MIWLLTSKNRDAILKKNKKGGCPMDIINFEERREKAQIGDISLYHAGYEKNGKIILKIKREHLTGEINGPSRIVAFCDYSKNIG